MINSKLNEIRKTLIIKIERILWRDLDVFEAMKVRNCTRFGLFDASAIIRLLKLQ